MAFNEQIFVHSLTTRPENARLMRSTFKPDWLDDARLRPILKTIYDFLSENHTSPSVSTLHQLLKDKDQSLYENRYRDVILELEKLEYTISDVIYNFSRARAVALSRSFRDRFKSELVKEYLEEDNGEELLKEF